MLRKEFIVEFSLELGVDAGAVKVEMFVSFFKQALREIFELVDGFGYMPKKVPPLLFKLLGFSIAHSFLQNGLPFPNLTNWSFEALVQSNEDVVCSQVSLNDIPLNAATSILKLFLKKVDDANTNEELDSLFRSDEGSAFEQIVNLSPWDMHTPISIENKTLLMSMLVYEELITKGTDQLKAYEKD